MLDPLHLSEFIIVLFVLIPFIQLIINPASISQSPTANDSMNVVAQTAAQSVAIFAIVLVIIQFILDNGPIQGYELLSINVLVLSACFLMLTFIMELFGDIKVLFFHLQLTALRYSGLLLFLGLFFLLLSNDLPDIIPALFGIFVAIAWSAWLVHEIHYLFFKQEEEWGSEDKTKGEWLSEQIESIRTKF